MLLVHSTSGLRRSRDLCQGLAAAARSWGRPHRLGVRDGAAAELDGAAAAGHYGAAGLRATALPERLPPGRPLVTGLRGSSPSQPGPVYRGPAGLAGSHSGQPEPGQRNHAGLAVAAWSAAPVLSLAPRPSGVLRTEGPRPRVRPARFALQTMGRCPAGVPGRGLAVRLIPGWNRRFPAIGEHGSARGIECDRVGHGRAKWEGKA